MKPLLLVLNSNNPGRVHHLQKISSLRDLYEVLLVIDRTSVPEEQMPYADHLLSFGMDDVDGNFSALADAIRKIGRPDGILNLSEFMVPLHARLVEEFELLGPDRQVAEVGRQKDLMRSFCEGLRIPVPRYQKVTSVNLHEVEHFSFPVIVKPTMGGGSQLVQRCDSWEELKAVFPRLLESARSVLRKEAIAARAIREAGEPPFIVEELIGGEVRYSTQFPYEVGEISVESMFASGEVTVLAIHDKPLPSNGPYFEEFIWSTPSRVDDKLKAKAFEYVSRIHRKLGRGAMVLHTEFRTLNDELVILEFGVRMGGAAVYRSVLHSTGVDMIEALVDIVFGRTPDLRPKHLIPTISHALWAERTGVVKAIHGEDALQQSAAYLDHSIFDHPGAKVSRAPLSTRAHGCVTYRSEAGFASIERELIAALGQFRIELE